MITEKDLEEAIAECQGQRNPNAQTCIKLAAYMTILKDMRGGTREEHPPSYSFAPAPLQMVEIDSGTEFAEAVNGREAGEVMAVMDELMTATAVYNPRLYEATLDRFRG